MGEKNLKLQIFLLCGPLKDLFFFAGKKTEPLLVYLIEYFINSLLGNVGNFFIGLCASDIVIEFVLFIFWFLLFLI